MIDFSLFRKKREMELLKKSDDLAGAVSSLSTKFNEKVKKKLLIYFAYLIHYAFLLSTSTTMYLVTIV